MRTGKLIVNFDGVSEYSNKLKTKAQDIKSNLDVPTLELQKMMVVPTYFVNFSSYTLKLQNFMNELSSSIMNYHDELGAIEGYAIVKTEPEPLGESERGHTTGGFTGATAPGAITIDGNITPDQGPGNESVDGLGRISISTEIMAASGYGSLPVNATAVEINSIIGTILAKYGLSTADVYSGQYNNVLTQILFYASNTGTFIGTITQLEHLILQAYLKDLSSAPYKFKQYLPIETFLMFVAKHNNTDFNALLSNPEYSELVKESLILHKESLVTLDALSSEVGTTIQNNLYDTFFSTEADPLKLDDVTEKILKDYLSEVANRNDISLESMLSEYEHADLTKESLDEFLKFWIDGEDAGFPVSNLVSELAPIAAENNTNVEAIVSGENTDGLTDYIDSTQNNNNVGEIINNMDENNLQDYLNEIVNDDKHPQIKDNIVVKEIIQKIVINKDYILGKGPKIDPSDNINTEIIADEPIVIDDITKEDLKTILTDKQYSDEIKEVILENNRFNWGALLPFAGLGLVPLVAAMVKKNKDKISKVLYVEEAKRGLIDNNFTYFADSNIVTEESLLDGTNFELLTIYLSQQESFSVVLDVLSTMRDDHLQKYLSELYNQKYEHIWSGNSLILKILFNSMIDTANRQGIDIGTLLTNSNYEVWVKTSIVELSKLYQKFEESITNSGSFPVYLEDVLGRNVVINENNYKLLKEYIDVNSNNLGIDQNTYLKQLTDQNSRQKVFAMINFGDGQKGYSFGINNAINILLNQNKNFDDVNQNTIDERVIESSGFLSLLFNSTDDQIDKAIDRILEKYSMTKDDLFGGDKEYLLAQLIDLTVNLNLTLFLLLKMDASKLQLFLNKLYLNPNKNKFILITLKYLDYLAKSENTTLKNLLSDPRYSDKIKESLSAFKKSILSLYAISKKNDSELNESINKIFFLEDPSVLGIDKITSVMFEDILSKMGNQENVGLNYILDIKNVEKLRSFVDKALNSVLFLKTVVDEENNITNKDKSKDVVQDAIMSKTDSTLFTLNLLKLDRIDSVLNVLIELDQKELQSYLNEMHVSSNNNNFILTILTFLKYLAKSENTSLSVLLTSEKYSDLIKSSLIDFKKSIINLDIISKKDYVILNEEMDKLFFVEDPKIFGVDKVTVQMIKDILSNSTKTDKTDLNSLLEYKNSEVLKKLITKILGSIMFGTLESLSNDIIDSNTRNDSIANENDMVYTINQIYLNKINVDPILKNKIKKYLEIMIKDSGLSFDEYLRSKEFSNFMNINFENSNLMIILNEYMKKGFKYSFDINQKIQELFENNNININAISSDEDLNNINNAITNENNCVFTLELVLSLNEESYNKLINQTYINKSNNDTSGIFNYIDENLKRPKQISMDEYLSDNQNTKSIRFFLLKILLMLLLLILLSKKEEEVI